LKQGTMTDSKGFMQILILYVGPWPRGGDTIRAFGRTPVGSTPHAPSLDRPCDRRGGLHSAGRGATGWPIRRPVPNAFQVIGTRRNPPARSTVAASTGWRPRAP